MNEPQIWTLIIGVLAALLTLVGLVTTWFTRLIRAEFAAVAARFEAVDVKLAHLDRDVQALTRHVFHRPES